MESWILLGATSAIARASSASASAVPPVLGIWTKMKRRPGETIMAPA